MFTFVKCAKAMTAASISVVALFGALTTAAADPSDNQANNDKLFAMLSGGLTPADCKAGKQYPQDPFLARLGCDRNPQLGGPKAVIYSLYGNRADLDKTFDISYGPAIPCPGPIDVQGGRAKCGHISYPQGMFELTWTKDADLVVVSADGPDLASLYAWWLTAR